MKKVLFIAVIILGLSSCIEYQKPIDKVEMNIMEQKFTQDTTSFDSYVKIIDDTYYFYTIDKKELYAKVPVESMLSNTAFSSFFLGLIIGLFVGFVITVMID